MERKNRPQLDEKQLSRVNGGVDVDVVDAGDTQPASDLDRETHLDTSKADQLWQP